MFVRLKNVLKRPSPVERQDDPVSSWATRHFLACSRSPNGFFDISGLLKGKPFRAECRQASRSYVVGLELRARVDLDLPPAGHVIVMSRGVKRALEEQANALYADVTGHLQTQAHEVPEEVRWLTLFRDTGWSGPPPRFWERYVVLTDAPDLARRWLDEDAVGLLLAGSASDAAAEVPVLVMLLRGKAYLRLQVNPLAQGADAALALELLEHLSDRALELGSRAVRAKGVSSRE